MGFPLRFCSCSYTGHPPPPLLFSSLPQQQWDTSCCADNHPVPHRDISSDALQFSKAAVNGLLFPFLLHIPPLISISLSLWFRSRVNQHLEVCVNNIIILAFFHPGSSDTLLNFIVIKCYGWWQQFTIIIWNEKPSTSCIINNQSQFPVCWYYYFNLEKNLTNNY